jgi:amino acid permease
MITLICIITLTLFIAALVGYVGYLAFGAKTKSVILYNLPNEDPAAITAKIFYIITIMGSFVIVINPIFYVLETSNWYKALSGQKIEDNKKDKEND